MKYGTAYEKGTEHAHSHPGRGNLSGEWAGESIPELSSYYGIDLEDEGVAAAFELGYADESLDPILDDAALDACDRRFDR